MSDLDHESERDFTQNQETQIVMRTGMPEMAPPLFAVCFVVMIFATSIMTYQFGYRKSLYDAQVETPKTVAEPTPIPVEAEPEGPEEEEEVKLPPAVMMADMAELYEKNSDVIGWLTIDGTNIDYAVMQTPEDEEYYLDRDFNKNKNANGCLIMDTDSTVGSGTAANDYADGTRPSTNLIIHGHNMRNGAMFGNLDRYKDERFYEEHKKIRFKSLYEEREYEVISVFLSQVFLKTQTDVFKYYKFFEAKDQAQFDDFYENIRKMALYDTGVTAEFGDEFITLSVCAYHVDNGRLVVVGKRIK